MVPNGTGPFAAPGCLPCWRFSLAGADAGVGYSWDNGHQPWLSSPLPVVDAWSMNHWSRTPAVRQLSANSFRVTEPGGRVDTLTGKLPVAVSGPWVLTRITYG
jgi:hypothetical protein